MLIVYCQQLLTNIIIFLATKTTLNAENIEQTLYFVSGLGKLQQIKNIN